MLEVGLTTLLTSAPALSALIAARIYPIELPTNPTLPAIAYKLVGSQSEASFSSPGYQRKRIEFAIHAGSYLQAITVKETLISEQITGTDLFIADDLEYVCTIEFYFGYVAAA
jgi:predicted nicotinamide N-methyase